MSKTIQKYARAVNSSSLADNELHHETDILAAMALSSKFGSLLLRAKYSGDQHSILPLLEVWREIVVVRSKRGKWAHLALASADISLWAWLDDICHICSGRGYPIEINTPTLKAATCQECNGTGRKPLQVDAEIKDYVLDCIQSLESMACEAGAKAMKKIGR